MTTEQKEWTKTLPNINVDSRPYWDAAKRHEILLQKCNSCGKIQHLYRKDFCCHCWSQDLDDIVASGKGTIWTYTIMYMNYTPGFKEDVPYVTALVELEEGVQMLTGILNCEHDKLKVGLPVKVTWVDATDEVSVAFFEPA
jgi:uncharacterized OB-fold protein